MKLKKETKRDAAIRHKREMRKRKEQREEDRLREQYRAEACPWLRVDGMGRLFGK